MTHKLNSTEKEVEQLLKDYIVQEFMQEGSSAKLENDTQIIEEEIIDSLGIFILIRFIEEKIKVKIEPHEVLLKNFETVNAIKSWLMTKLMIMETSNL